MKRIKYWTEVSYDIPIEGEPGYFRTGWKWDWKEAIRLDYQLQPKEEVIEDLGSDKEGILSLLDTFNKEYSDKQLLADSKNFNLAEVLGRKVSLAYYHEDRKDEADLYAKTGITEEEAKSHLFANKWCTILRSTPPMDRTPWKRISSRTYKWCVPLKDAYKNAGRRIEWEGDTKVFNSRKEALTAMYGA